MFAENSRFPQSLLDLMDMGMSLVSRVMETSTNPKGARESKRWWATSQNVRLEALDNLQGRSKRAGEVLEADGQLGDPPFHGQTAGDNLAQGVDVDIPPEMRRRTLQPSSGTFRLRRAARGRRRRLRPRSSPSPGGGGWRWRSRSLPP